MIGISRSHEVRREVFADGDRELVLEALHCLRERKQDALDEAGRHSATSMFNARDFGIPQIDALLMRLNAESPADIHAATTDSLLANNLIEAVRGWLWAKHCGASVDLAESYVRAAFAEAMPSVVTRSQTTDVELPTAPGQIGIRLEGGVVQSVFADRPMAVIVIDYDTEGCDEQDLFAMPQDDGTTSDCVVQEYAASVMPKECKRIRDALNAAVKHEVAAEDEPDGLKP